jgi:hypothetical protein
MMKAETKQAARLPVNSVKTSETDQKNILTGGDAIAAQAEHHDVDHSLL